MKWDGVAWMAALRQSFMHITASRLCGNFIVNILRSLVVPPEHTVTTTQKTLQETNLVLNLRVYSVYAS